MRWCQWVEPIEGAEGEGADVLFFRNRNGLGVKPSKVEAPGAVKGAKYQRPMMVEAEEDDE